MASYNYWPTLVRNLIKLQTKWPMSLSILVLGGENTRVLGMSFKVVIQAVIIFGSFMWLMTPCMGRALGGFHHRVV